MVLARDAMDWLLRPEILGALAFASALMLAASLVALPVLIVRMPADWLARDDDPAHASPSAHPVLRLLTRLLRNVLGLVLVLAGIAMLVLPGQGVLTILAGLLLTDVPGKRRLRHAIAKREALMRLLDRLRTGRGAPPLQRRPLADAE